MEKAKDKLDKENWFPLESNPFMLNQYAEKLGMDTSKYAFSEMMSTEDWALEMIARPVLAVVVVYPMTVNILVKQINAIEQQIKEGKHKNEDKLYFMKQFAENACGTIGLLHAIYNSLHRDPQIMKKGSFLDKFYQETKDLSYDETGIQLKQNNELKEEHKNVAQSSSQNQSQSKQLADSHFAVYIEKNNKLFMMDGLTEFPIYIGPTTQNTLLEDGVKEVKNMMQLEPNLINFSLMVLGKFNPDQLEY